MKRGIVLAGVLVLAISTTVALAQQAGIPIQTQEGTIVTIPDATVQWLCGNNGAWLRWLIGQLGPWASWIFGLLGMSVVSSMAANFADKLPAPIRVVVNALALNFRNPPPAAAAP